eukprot:gnl/MRDRNA2_/MRDRNA2_91415_c0_seq1.p1 gnl/MRDRNA2_/MRDRNA2_91415_c0~~gnl/MRDRNA2_/MRDRNA2_91415_c0_seq1.p1  ORF type:complete len:411 (-),score=88.66 gnl/MRDRNA2_/MRDRNA2_91415_c0_seq1:69-1301(-)
MGIITLFFSFNAPKVLSIQDVRLGFIHRTWQLLVAVGIAVLCMQEEPWRKRGMGRHFFTVAPELPSDTSPQLLSVQDQSFFVPLNYTYQQESRCESGIGWCATSGTSQTTLTAESSKTIKLSVTARFEPHEDVFEWSATQIKLFTHDKGFDMSMNEIFSQLAQEKGMQVDEWIAATASKGAEAQLTYNWQCEDSSDLAEGDCEVKVELGQISSSHGFQVSSVQQPVATQLTQGGIAAVRSRSHVTGLTVHMRGEGGIEATSITTILGIVSQAVIFLLIGNQIVTIIALSVLKGGPRRSLRCTEHYNDEVHQQIAEIVKAKKEAQPELSGLSDATLHAKLVDDIETLCGCELHGNVKKEKVGKVLTALVKTQGSVHLAAQVLGEDGSALRLAMLKEAAKTKFDKEEATNIN